MIKQAWSPRGVGAGIGAGLGGGATWLANDDMSTGERLGTSALGGMLGGAVGYTVGHGHMRNKARKAEDRKRWADYYHAQSEARRAEHEKWRADFKAQSEVRRAKHEKWQADFKAKYGDTFGFGGGQGQQSGNPYENFFNSFFGGRQQQNTSNAGSGYRQAPPPQINTSIDFMKELGFPAGIKTKDEAKKHFRSLARTHHPDHGGDAEKMKKINASWEDAQKSPWFFKLSHLLGFSGMTKQAYIAGQQAAHEELQKEAGIKDILKRTALAGALTIPTTAAGGLIGASKGQSYMAKAPLAALDKVLHGAPKVDSAAYYAKNAPGAKTMVGEQGWGKWLGELGHPKEDIASTAKQINTETKYPMYYPMTKSIHAPDQAPESFLAHELGHHAAGHPGNNIFNVVTGNTLKNEQAAWDFARKSGANVDPQLEQAALETYRQGQTGARAGGAAGAATGLGGSLWALSRMMRKRRENL